MMLKPILFALGLMAANSAFAVNDSIVLKCTPDAKPDRPEGLSIFKNGTWTSPPGGWLPHQMGKWTQNGTSGVVLEDESGKRFAEALGVIFKTVTPGTSGVRFHVDGSGDTGRCEVTAVTP